jgi:hypothetical protein
MGGAASTMFGFRSAMTRHKNIAAGVAITGGELL